MACTGSATRLLWGGGSTGLPRRLPQVPPLSTASGRSGLASLNPVPLPVVLVRPMSSSGRGHENGGGSGSGGSSSRKGELSDLKEGLHSSSNRARRDALRRVIASMTVGKDMSTLFTDVLQCTQTPSVELKKLVYLYLVHYAAAKPELTILIVNTLLRDAAEENPLLRALALRTMASMRVDRMAEYLVEPLHRALSTPDAYVRKTAALCVAKMYDTNPALTVEEGFLDNLTELLSDSNATVVVNAVAALAEISESRPGALSLTPASVRTYMAALGECTEWGQVTVMDALADYTPADAEEADDLVEHVLPRLQHANAAVVLAAVRLLLQLLTVVSRVPGRNSARHTFVYRKMASPLLTLLSAKPEMQYVALRNMGILVRARPAVLAGNVRAFFCKYNDPLYVKVEKLELIVRLTRPEDAVAVLAELREYANEVDVSFVSRAINAIGQVALGAAESTTTDRGVEALITLLARPLPHVVQPAVLALRDVFRRHPGRYGRHVAAIAADSVADVLDDADAKAALAWILGEYADVADGALTRLRACADALVDESPAVQLCVLSASVKCLLRRPSDRVAQTLASDVVRFCMSQSESVDVRDRGFLYARLLQAVSGLGSDGGGGDADSAVANRERVRRVVLANKPASSGAANELPTELVEELLGHLSTLAAIYHWPVHAIHGVKPGTVVKARTTGGDGVSDLLFGGDGTEEPSQAKSDGADATVDGTGGAASSSKAVATWGPSGADDFFGLAGPSSQAVVPVAPPSSSGPVASSSALSLLDDLLGTDAVGGAVGAVGGGNGGLAGDAGLLQLTGAAHGQAPAPVDVRAPASGAAAHQRLPASTARVGATSSIGGGPLGNPFGSPAPPPFEQATDVLSSSLPADVRQVVLISGAQGRGLVVHGGLSAAATDGVEMAATLWLAIANHSAGPVDSFAVQVNSNLFGLVPAAGALAGQPALPAGGSVTLQVPLHASGTPTVCSGVNTPAGAAKALTVQVALKVRPIGVLYFADRLAGRVASLFPGGSALPKRAFLAAWSSVRDDAEVAVPVMVRLPVGGAPPEGGAAAAASAAAVSALSQARLFLVARRTVGSAHVMYFASRLPPAVTVLAEVSVPPVGGGAAAADVPAKLAIRVAGTSTPLVGALLSQAVASGVQQLLRAE